MRSTKAVALWAVCLLSFSGCNPGNNPIVAPDIPPGAAVIAPLDPQAFVPRDKAHRGWEVALPGAGLNARAGALATPAVVDGTIFVGGGFASTRFFALDAATGRHVWEYVTADHGPTAAVVAEGRVVFCTESCELEVLDVTGERLWKKWLGNSLLSMPAVSARRVYAAYPDTLRAYHLLCADLQTGDEVWNRPIPAEVITAPVVHENLVLAATLDGTLSCFDAETGRTIWTEAKNATSAPVVANHVAYFGRREESQVSDSGSSAREVSERIAMRGLESHSPIRDIPGTERDPKLVRERQGLFREVLAALGGEPVDTPSHTTLSEAGMLEIWNYEGLKPFVAGGNLYAAVDGKVICVGLDDHTVRWKQEIPPAGGREAEAGSLDQRLTAPAIVNGKVFVGTRDGRLVCLSAASGELLWSVEIGDPVLSQPAVAAGRVYVGTGAGSVIAVETGDAADDGWLMWGANPAHDGRVKTPDPIPAAL